MFNPHFLVAMLNKNLKTQFEIISAPEVSLKRAQDPLLQTAYQDNAFSVLCPPQDLAYQTLLVDLFIAPEAQGLNPTERAWLAYLQGQGQNQDQSQGQSQDQSQDQSQPLPQFPLLDSPEGYRLCQLSSFETTAKGEILDVALELLPCHILYALQGEILLAVENQASLKEALEAFYQTVSLEFSQSIQLVVSPSISKPSALIEAYRTLLALASLPEKNQKLQGILYFEAYFSELILQEWLSLSQSPLCKSILEMKTQGTLDDETRRTIEVFFKMNLNLTDTARALFIHRNTLIYRLDKIEKQWGFDLRHFEDAFQVKWLLSLL